MDENTKKQIEHLSKVFGADKMVSASDIAEVLKGLKSILNDYKKETAELNQETRQMVEDAIDNIKVKYDELVSFADDDISTKKEKLSEESTTIKEQIADELETLNIKIGEVGNFLKEVKSIKVQKGKDGKNGRDGIDGTSVNKDEVISEILENIKLPEYEIFNLEEKGEQIVNEINALPLEDEYKIDASHIKNLPKSKATTAGPHYLAGDNITIEGNVISSTSSGSALTVQDIDGNPTATNVNTIKFTNGSVTDDGAGVVTVTTGSGGGGDVSSSVGVSVDSEIALFDGTGGKTIKRATGTGIATLTSGVLSATATTGSGSVVLATSPTLVTPALGTPSALVGTNITGTASGLSIGGNAATVTVADAGGDTTTFPMLATSATGSLAPATDAGLSYNATTNALTTTTFIGALTGNADTATSATSASTATTLTGLTSSVAELNILDGVTATATELNYVDGVTSAIQTQIDAKANSAGALTQFVGNGNYKVWYSDGSGDVQELALGADGTFLKSNGAAVAPSFATPAGSGDVSKVGTPVNNQIGVWTGDGTIEGTTGLTYDGSNFLLTGDIGATGTRVTKGWFTDLQVTNAIAGSVTGNAATVTTNANLTGVVTSTGNATAIADSALSIAKTSGLQTALDAKAPLASPTFTGTVTIPAATITGNLNFSAVPATDHTAIGPTISAFNLGATIALMDLVYLGSSSKWLLTDADAAATTDGLLGICLDGGVDTDTTTVALPGSFVRDDTWAWTPGVPLYVDTATPGQIVATAPSGTDDGRRRIGFAVTADVIYFMPGPIITHV